MNITRRQARRPGATLALAFAAAALLWCATSESTRAQEGGALAGEWALEFGPGPGDVRLTIYSHSGVSGNGSSTLILPRASLRGLAAGLPAATRTPVKFSLAREAGTFDFEGQAEGARGAGRWRLTPDPDFLAEMRWLGYDKFYDHQLLVAVVYDLNKGYIAGLKEAGYDGVPLEQLLGARMFGVSIAFVKEVQSLGVRGASVGGLTSMRMFSVTPEFIRELGAQGYERLSADELVGLRMNNVTPEFIAGLRAQGYGGVSVSDLGRMRMFQVDGEFIARTRRLGYKGLTVDQLVGLRFQNAGR
ncbi:MAG TPA: hypothetical protein VF591_00095 [Pyrinomonadaceae bacterium]|jgi:hypothetical protein